MLSRKIQRVGLAVLLSDLVLRSMPLAFLYFLMLLYSLMLSRKMQRMGLAVLLSDLLLRSAPHTFIYFLMLLLIFSYACTQEAACGSGCSSK
jgi:hypothetical protein